MNEISRYSDEELVGLSLANKSFFAEIVERYERKLSTYIYRIGRLSPEDIEDLLQEVFLAVYQNLNSFDQDLKFSSWIYRITHNTTMAYFRKRKVRPQGHLVEESEAVLQELAAELNLKEELEANDDARVLLEALEELPQEYKDIIVLKFFEHKSYDEISDILAMPGGTVATRINRGKERIRDLLHTRGFKP
jgi:RNA polymerase sigma-70 factor, ECF subfamily